MAPTETENGTETETGGDDVRGERGRDDRGVGVDPARLPRVTRLSCGPPMDRQPCADGCGRWAVYRVNAWRVPRYLCRGCLGSVVAAFALGDVTTATDEQADGSGGSDAVRG